MLKSTAPIDDPEGNIKKELALEKEKEKQKDIEKREIEKKKAIPLEEREKTYWDDYLMKNDSFLNDFCFGLITTT